MGNEYTRRRCRDCGARTVHFRAGWPFELRGDALVLVRLLAWILARPLDWWFNPWTCEPCYRRRIRELPDDDSES